jgi:Tfp pilus assembly protein PilZ
MMLASVPDAAPAVARPPARGGVLVFGRPNQRVLGSLTSAAREARLETNVEGNLPDFDAWLEHSRPVAIVVDGAAREAADACLRVRYDPLLANIPIIGMADVVSDLGFEELFGWSGDDLTLRGVAEPMARRLRAVATAGTIPLSGNRGVAVVADPDRRARLLVARSLRNAGLGVTFALSGDELISQASCPNVVAAIQSANLDGAEGDSLVSRARKAGVTASWVITTPPREAARMRERIAGVSKVAVYDAFGSPENVLFVINELCRGALPEGRSSSRVLYGTAVRFRVAGCEEDEVGFSYNISEGGLFVRTLAPPPAGSETWIELRPPRSDRRVRLEGRVVWVRRFGTNDIATVPPGFAIETVDGSARDVERYLRGYRTFASEMLGRSISAQG